MRQDEIDNGNGNGNGSGNENENENGSDNAAPPNHNGNQNGNQNQAAQEINAPHLLTIQDEEEWIRQNGLGQHADDGYGQESPHNLQEARQRVLEQESYEQQVHERLFSDNFQQQEADARVKQEQLDEWENEIIHVVTSSASSPYSINLCQFARSSDTVFALAKSRPHYESSSDHRQHDQLVRDNSQLGLELELEPLSLSLLEYPDESVQVFLQLFQIQTWNNDQQVSVSSIIPAEHMVTCCHLAHYLQCTDILDEIVSILRQSIDSANCLSLSQLADQLQLHELLELSLDHMMRTLGDLQERDVWGDLSPELQNRILTIQTLLQ
jgi:hypothetical protein